MGLEGTGALPLPPLLSCKSFVQECQNLGDVELNILKVKILEIVFLHLQEIIELQIKFQQATGSTCE